MLHAKIGETVITTVTLFKIFTEATDTDRKVKEPIVNFS